MILTLLFCLPALSAHADSDKIVVTATRSAEDAETLPFSVGVVDGRRWEAAGGDPIAALSEIPGVSFTSGGGAGQIKSVLIRGGLGEHTLVLIDGIPVNDPLGPSRAFDFAQIPVSEIDHVEVLKGPQSVLYGSDALGGVVQIFTKKHGRRVRAEGGSYRTATASAAFEGFRAGVFGTRGFSAADSRDGNTEPDAYRAWNVGGSEDIPVSDSFLMRLTAQYQDSHADTDSRGGPGGDSYNTYSRHEQLLAREENVVFLPHEAELTIAGNYSQHAREDNTNGADDYYRSDLWKVEAVTRVPLGANRLTAGQEYAREGGRSSQTSGGRRDFRMGAFYLQDQAKLGESLDAVLGGRLDLHSETEMAKTWRAGLSWRFLPELRAKGSLGTGFKAPSLFQTYSSFGSTNLRPGRSLGGDLGLEATHGDWKSELTGFATSYRDLIDFNTVTNRFFNQTRARTSGVEFSVERAYSPFRAANALTFLRAVDPDTGKPLLRRPRWTDNLTFGYLREKKAGFDVILRYVGERDDLNNALNTRQPMPAFFTLGVDFFHALTKSLRLTMRGENLLDRHYQETSGFGVPGISGYAGVEADL